MQVNRRFHRDERQRHEPCEASGTCLQLADPQDMPRPVTRMVDMTEHDGGGRPDAEVMRGLDYLEPLCAVVTLSGQMTACTSSSRISAAVPGIDPSPAPSSSVRNSRTESRR